MALTKCAECGNMVSTLAAACPSCGAPVMESHTTEVPAKKSPDSAASAKKPPNAAQSLGGCFVLLCLVCLCGGVCAGVFKVFSDSTPDEAIKKNPDIFFVIQQNDGTYFQGPAEANNQFGFTFKWTKEISKAKWYTKPEGEKMNTAMQKMLIAGGAPSDTVRLVGVSNTDNRGW